MMVATGIMPAIVAILEWSCTGLGLLEDISTADEKLLGVCVREEHDTDFYVLDQVRRCCTPYSIKRATAQRARFRVEPARTVTLPRRRKRRRAFGSAVL